MGVKVWQVRAEPPNGDGDKTFCDVLFRDDLRGLFGREVCVELSVLFRLFVVFKVC